jgi:hypothetical protein
MTTRARLLPALLAPAALGGCAALGFMSGPGDGSPGPAVPIQAVEAAPVNAGPAASDCPHMPTVGLTLPRGDSVVVPDDGSVTRVPTVPLDSAGHPIRVAPLCRVAGSGR